MINRASVQLWDIVGQSAGPPKWAGKNRVCRSCATDPILSTQRIPRGRDPENFLGDDAAENRDFQTGKQRLVCSKKFTF